MYARFKNTRVGCKRYEILKGALSYPSVSNNKHQVATPEVVRWLPHAAKFADHFSEIDDNAEVLLVIGLDNQHLHKTARLTDKAPYVHRTPIDHALVGRV